MKIESRQLAEIVGIFAVVVSLLFVGYELRLARAVAEDESISQRIELATSIREQITSNSDIWVKGCLGEELTPKETVEFTNVASSVISYEFYRWRRANISNTDAPTLNGPRVVARNIYSFPGFAAFWEKAGVVSPEFIEIVNEQHAILVETSAEKFLDVGWCGH